MTKLARLTFVFTVVNLGLFVWLVAQTGRASAQDAAPVLRGRGLEIVDDQGRVRASITRYGKDSGRSSAYDDMVIFRLHDRAGKPMIKLDTHETVNGLKGSGLGLLGASDETQAYIGTDGLNAKVDLKSGDGRRQQLQP
jgi:hypothetical protein